MKKLFEAPEMQIVTFENEILTKDPSIGDGDVDFNFDDLQ